ncbi:ATP-binding protein [Kineococcus aurantiacus]|uniref:DNA-binding NarL/FixJ family response regulator n=1 Tax=Kineococcus aurantiacus TaxID=37633 RepID=A0A7Y9DKS7_9ACTN|nr:LuxR family transcriptional regulator [Kineococcus aurantiacus]NYD22442.1 DNA-binding NarL/FixJ family response regulator [Kineococcus aurantiacus]
MTTPTGPHDPAAVLVGRLDELALLRGLLGQAAAGRGSGALVVGEAGLGKTALVSALAAEAAAAGFRVLRCRGFRGGEDTGFAGLHELLHPVLDRVDALPARQRQALEVIFGRAAGGSVDRLVLSLATTGLLEEAAQDEPLALVLEDLHWVDPSSTETLVSLPQRLGGTRALVLATTRPDPSRPSPARAFPHVVRLEPLPPGDAGALLSSRAPDLPARVRARVLEESLGNPLALTELATQWVRTGRDADGGHRISMSRRLEQTFLSEVHGLPAGTRRALLVVAAGQDASQPEVLTALGLLGLGAGDLAPAERAGLLGSEGDRFLLRHPLVGSALYDAAGSAERSQVHTALAQAVPSPARRVRHRAAAVTGWDTGVAAELADVADLVFRQGATAEASTLWRRASALTPRPQDRARLLASAAEAARQAGASVDAAALLTQVRAVVDPTQFEVVRRSARTDWLLSMTADHRGRSTLDLVDLARDLPERVDRAEVLVWAATKCYVLQEPGDVRAAVRSALAGEDPGSSLRRIGLALVDPGAPLDVATFERFRTEAQDVDGVLLNCLAFSAEDAGDLVVAETCWSSAVDVFHGSGRTGDETIALCGRATPRVTAGDLAGGLADAEQALRLSRELDLPVVAAMAAAVVARARAWGGERDRALEALRQAEALPAAVPFARVAASAAWAAGVVALNDGRHADALRELAGAAVNAPVALWAGGDLAEAAVRTGRLDAVHDWLRTASDAVQVSGSAHLGLLLERSRALLAGDDAAEQHFRAALEHGRRAGTGFDVARTRLHYGEWLRRQRRITEARDQLVAALRVFDELLVIPLADRARQELRAAGGTDDAGASEGPPRDLAVRSLTAQELMVAVLAAQGLSNREIADQVYLSHRTVGSHLHHAFAKLQVSRRSHLAAALAGRV